MIDPELLELMPDEITYEPRSGLSGYNTPTYGDPVTLRARVERRPRMVRDSQGREVVSNARITLAVPADILTTGRVSQAGKFENEVILSVATSPDEVGPYCVVIYI